MTIATELTDKKTSNVPPRFEGDSQQCVTAHLGDDVTLTMQLAASGGIPTSFTWARGDRELSGDRYRFSENNNTVLLSLQHVTEDDVGFYTLIAKNAVGEARRAVELKLDEGGVDAPVFLRRLSDLAVKVGTRTRFLVEIRSSSDIKVTWYHNDHLVQEGERFTFLHEGNFFCVDVAPVMVEDGDRWTCMAENTTGRSSCSSHLNVLVPKAYKSPEFLEELKALLTEQGTVSLECKVIGVPTPVLHWYKDGKEIKAGDIFALTANPDDPTSLGTYTCEAVNCMGKTYSSSRVHVVGKGSREGSLKPADNLRPVGPPPVFSKELLPVKTKIGDTITLACKVTVPPWPKSITWYNHEGRVDSNDKYHIMEDGLGGYMLEVSPVELVDEGEWKCVATSSEGAMGISKTQVSVSYPKNFRKPRFLESLKAILTEEGLVSFECKVVGFPTPQLRWFKDGQELRPGDVYQLTGTNSLGSYSCIAKNCMGEATSSAELTVEDIQNQLNEEERLQLFSTNQPPKFIQGLKSCEGKINEEFRFTVQVSISPEPTVTWYRDDEHVFDSDRYHTSRETLGYCHLDIRVLEIVDQAEWKCVATNEFGHSVTSCFLKLSIPKHFKKPRFLECLRAILSEEGAVNLECKVIGVPQPVLKWYKDGEELKPGDIHRIISGQDGTCCLGTYTCEAHNCMGTVASSASLLGFEDRMLMKTGQQRVDQTVAPAGHIIARNPSLSTIHEERTSQMYDTPATERSLTVDERPEISFSFDGKEVSVSLYETPDLTEEEALQVVEMYAEQLSEHVSEHNVVDLPPMRFVKESSHSGKLLMEAVVIDVTGDYFTTAEDDLRTDADVEELSITDDAAQQAAALPPDLEVDDIPFDRLNSEFMERALAPTVPYVGSDELSPPKRPPRRKSETSRTSEAEPAKQSSDTFHSISQSKGASAAGKVPPPDDDQSEAFSDAQASELDTPSKYETFVSARGSIPQMKEEEFAYQVAVIEEQKTELLSDEQKLASNQLSTQSSPAELVRNTQIETKKRKGVTVDDGVQMEHSESKVESSTQTGSLKKKVRTVESGQGDSFENIAETTSFTKSDIQSKEISVDLGMGKTEDIPTTDIVKQISSSEKVDKISEEDNDFKTSGNIQVPSEDIANLGDQKTKGRSLKRKGSKKSQSEKSEEIKKEAKSISSKIKADGETNESQKGESATKKKRLSATDLDLPTLPALEKHSEQPKPTSQSSESDVLEALTRSLQDIQKGLTSVEAKVISENIDEPASAISSLSVLESLSQPIQNIQKGLALVEQHSGSSSEEHSTGKTGLLILEKLVQPIQELQRGLELVEEKVITEKGEESLLERTILQNVAQPVEELKRGMALIQQQAILESSTETTVKPYSQGTTDLSSRETKFHGKLEALQALRKPIQEIQTGISILQQQAPSSMGGDLSERNACIHILTTFEKPLEELKQYVSLVEQKPLLEDAAGSTYVKIDISMLDGIFKPIQELQTNLALVEQQAALEAGDGFEPDIMNFSILKILSKPIKELERHFFRIKSTCASDIPLDSYSRSSPELQTLEQSIQELTREIVTIAKLAVMKKKSESESLATLGNLAPPLLKLQKELVQVERSIVFENLEDPEKSSVPLPSLKKLSFPLTELRHGLTEIKLQLEQESSDVLTSGEQHITALKALAMPIENLKKNIFTIQQEVVSGSNAREKSEPKLELLIKPFQEVQKGLIQVEQVVLEVAPELIPQTSNLLTVRSLTQCVHSLERKIASVQRATQFNNDTSRTAALSLGDLAQPLLQLKKSLVQYCLSYNVDQPFTSKPKLPQLEAAGTLLEPLLAVKSTLDEVEKHIINLRSTGPITDTYKTELLSMIEPIKEIKANIKAVQRQAVLEPTSSKVEVLDSLISPLEKLSCIMNNIEIITSETPGHTVIDRLTKSVGAVQIGIDSIEKCILSTSKECSEPEGKAYALSILKAPLNELAVQLHHVQKEESLRPENGKFANISSMSLLNSLEESLNNFQAALGDVNKDLQKKGEDETNLQLQALTEPVRHLQRDIAMVQHQAVLESGVVTDSEGSSVLEKLFHPLQMLQKGLVTIESQSVGEMCEVSSSQVIESVNQTVLQLEEKVSYLEKQAELETGLTKGTLSVVGALGEPLRDIQRGLVLIKQHALHESTKEPQSEIENLSALENLLVPLEQLNSDITNFKIPSTGEAPSIRKEILTILQPLTYHIQDVQREIDTIQQKAVMEGEPVYGKSQVSVLQLLSQPLQELSKGLLVIEKLKTAVDREEKVTEQLEILKNVSDSALLLKQNVNCIDKCSKSEKTEGLKKEGLGMLGNLSEPLQELSDGLLFLQDQIQHLSVSETLPEVSALHALKDLTNSFNQLQKDLTSLKRIALEPLSEQMAKKVRITTIKAINKSIYELRKDIAVVQQQAVIESGSLSISATPSVLETLFKPLQKLQKCLSSIEESKLSTPQTSKLVELGSIMILEDVSHSLDNLRKEILKMDEAKPMMITEECRSTLGMLSEPLTALIEGIDTMEYQITESSSEIKPQSATLCAIETLVKPMHEIVQNLTILEHQQLSEPESTISTGNLDSSVLKTVAVPMSQLEESIVMIQNQVSMESSEERKIDEPAQLSIAQPLEDLRKRLMLIQKYASNQSHVQPLIQQPKIETVSDMTITSGLATLAELLNEAHESLGKAEQHILSEPYEESISEKTSQSILRTMAQPLQELQRHLVQVEQVILAKDEPLLGERSISAIKVLAQPVKEIQREIAVVNQQLAFEAVGEHISEGDSICMLQNVLKPVEDLYKAIAEIEQQETLDTREKLFIDEASIAVIKAVVMPIQEIHQTLATVQQHTVLDAREESISEKISLSLLKTLAEPLHELQQHLVQIEQQIPLESQGDISEQGLNLSIIKTLAQPVKEIQRGLAVIEQHTVLEAKGENISEKESLSLLQTLAKPIEEMNRGIAQIQEQLILEGKEGSIAEQASFINIQTVAKPIHEMHRALATVQQQVILEAREESLSEKTNISLLKTLAEPLQQLQKHIIQMEVQVPLELHDESSLEGVSISLLKTLAQPAEELQRGIAMIEHQILLEGRGENISEKESLSTLQTLAQPIIEMHRGIAQLQQQVALDAKEQTMSEKPEIAVLKAMAKPIQELYQSVITMQPHMIFEPQEESLSDKTSISVLQTLAQPLQELHKHLVQIEQQVVLEPQDESMSEKSNLSLLKTLAQPVEEIQRGVAMINHQIALEVAGINVPKEATTNILYALSQPVEELYKCIAQIEHQVAVEPQEESMSEKASISLLKTIAQPIRELREGIVTHEQHVLEVGELFSEKSQVTLQTLAQPIHELCQGLAVIEHMIPLEPREEPLSQKEDISFLKTLAHPIQEIQKQLVQIEHQITLEAEKTQEMVSLDLLHAVAMPLQELQRNIATIEEHAQFETGEKCIGMLDLSLIKTIAKPLQELQRGLLIISQQEILEGFVEPTSEDGTNFSDLPTLASSKEVSQNLDMLNIEEQCILEGDVRTLSEKPNLQDIKAIAVPVQEPSKSHAFGEQQAAFKYEHDSLSELDSFTSHSPSESEEKAVILMDDGYHKGVAILEEQRIMLGEEQLKESKDGAEKVTASMTTVSERGIATIESQEMLVASETHKSFKGMPIAEATVEETSQQCLALIQGQETLYSPEECKDESLSDMKTIAEVTVSANLGLATTEQPELFSDFQDVSIKQVVREDVDIHLASFLGVPEVQQAEMTQEEHIETLSNIESLSKEEYAMESDTSLLEAAAIEEHEAIMHGVSISNGSIPEAQVAKFVEASQKQAIELEEVILLSAAETITEGVEKCTQAELKSVPVMAETAMIEDTPETQYKNLEVDEKNECQEAKGFNSRSKEDKKPKTDDEFQTQEEAEFDKEKDETKTERNEQEDVEQKRQEAELQKKKVEDEQDKIVKEGIEKNKLHEEIEHKKDEEKKAKKIIEEEIKVIEKGEEEKKSNFGKEIKEKKKKEGEEYKEEEIEYKKKDQEKHKKEGEEGMLEKIEKDKIEKRKAEVKTKQTKVETEDTEQKIEKEEDKLRKIEMEKRKTEESEIKKAEEENEHKEMEEKEAKVKMEKEEERQEVERQKKKEDDERKEKEKMDEEQKRVEDELEHTKREVERLKEIEKEKEVQRENEQAKMKEKEEKERKEKEETETKKKMKEEEEETDRKRQEMEMKKKKDDERKEKEKMEEERKRVEAEELERAKREEDEKLKKIEKEKEEQRKIEEVKMKEKEERERKEKEEKEANRKKEEEEANRKRLEVETKKKKEDDERKEKEKLEEQKRVEAEELERAKKEEEEKSKKIERKEEEQRNIEETKMEEKKEKDRKAKEENEAKMKEEEADRKIQEVERQKKKEDDERKEKEKMEEERKRAEDEENERTIKEEEEKLKKIEKQNEEKRKIEETKMKKEKEEKERKEQEEREAKVKEEEATDRKRQEMEMKKKKEDDERKEKEKMEEERKRVEDEELERTKREVERLKEIEKEKEMQRKKEEAELKEKEEKERKEKEETEAKKKKEEEEETDRKRHEMEVKKKEDDERKEKEKVEEERKRVEAEERERTKKGEEEELKKIEKEKEEKKKIEETKFKEEKKEKERKEREEKETKMRMEEEEADRKRQEVEVQEKKKKKEDDERREKEKMEEEQKRVEAEEHERKKKDENRRKSKEEEEENYKKLEKEKEESRRKEETAMKEKREKEEKERKPKEKAKIKKEGDSERKTQEAELQNRKEEDERKGKEKLEADRSRINNEETGHKMKDEDKHKEKEEDRKRREDEVIKVATEMEEPSSAEGGKEVERDTTDELDGVERAGSKQFGTDLKELSEMTAQSFADEQRASRNRYVATDVGKVETEPNDVEQMWVVGKVTQRSRSCDPRNWKEEDTSAQEISLESSDTLTPSETTSTLMSAQLSKSRHRAEATEDRSISSLEELPSDVSRRRSGPREKVESGPRDYRKKPVFCTRLTDRTATQGSRIKLTCSVLGSPEPVVHWLRDGLPLEASSTDKKFRTSCEDGLAILQVLNAAPGDSGEYTCVARNLHGETSTTATLKVYAGFEPAPFPPTFTRAIRDVYRVADDELLLECRVRSQPAPRITWLKNGVPLVPSSRYQQTELPDGVCRLTISSPDTIEDSGQYTCRAENALWADQISSAIRFTGREQHLASRRSERVNGSRVPRDVKRPHFTSVLTDHLVPSGGTIALQVEVKGAPKPEVTWLRGSEELPSSPRYRTFEEAGVYTLMVANATESEAGMYTCRAYNIYGHMDTSAAVQVIPHGSVRGGRPAMFLSRPDYVMAVAVGEDITVSFRVTGDPKPRVTWMKGTRDITNSQRCLKETIDDYVRLTLKRALPSDVGTYCILAKNAYGCDRSFVTIRIRQRARSLTPGAEGRLQETSIILRDVRDELERSRRKDVPAAVAAEPVVTDSGRNWLTLSWPKSENRGGVPVLAYRVEAWELGDAGGARWVELGVSPINSYDAFKLKPGCEYQFRVTPRNRYGWGESVTTTKPVLVGKPVELPEFIRILPGQLKALQGSNIRLECQVRGDPIPQVRWYRDGTELDFRRDNCPRFSTSFNGNVCVLEIKELTEEDSGRYMCEATNKEGRVSTFARLMVVNDPKIWEADTNLKRGIQEEEGITTDSPPQFTMRLRDRRVQMTYPVRLTCQVAGRPTPELVWSKDGQELKQDERHTFWNEEHFHTLELSHTTLEDSGCYSATIRNAHGSVSCRCHLVVDKGIRAYVAPEFVFDLEPEYSVKEGGNLRLSAQVEAYPTVGVMWHRDGVRLRPSRRTIMTLDHDGTVELALAGVTARDAGVYSCTATNEVGRCETTGRVAVLVTTPPPAPKPPQVIGPETPYSKAPLFITKPRSTEAIEGDTVIIHCEVVGDPKPEVMWLRDWLKPDYYRDAPHFRRVGDGPEYRLEIPRAKLDYTGAYSVIARNCHGEAKAVISLQIYAKGQGKEDRMDASSVKHGKVQTLPVIKRELKDLRCCDGDAVTLECRVFAIPKPDIRWEKGGRLLPLGGDFAAEFDGETARLSIQQVFPEDEGEYTCVAYNELGRALTSACLVVDVPEEKETLLSRQLSRPPGLLSAGSTPRSTPRTTPTRSKSPSVSRFRDRDVSPYDSGSRPRRLKIAAPKFYAVPHNRVAEEGETVRFQCAIAGHPTPWVTWDKDGLLVTPSARLTLSEKDDLRVLQVEEVTPEDAGLYRVTLENEVGRVEASARLEVIGRHGSRTRGIRAWSASPRTSPTFGRRLIGTAARVGGRMALTCDIRGSPAPATTWYRNGEMVVRSERVTPSWDGRTARLEVEALEAEDAGVYTCVAENEAGKTSCSAKVEILEVNDDSDRDRQPPHFIQGLPKDTMAVDGQSLELLVRLTGTSPIDVVWVKDDNEIPDCDDFRYVDYGDGRFALRIADVFPQDSGEYRSEAFSPHGEPAITCGRLLVQECSTSGISAARLVFSKKPSPVLAAPGGSAAFCARLQSDDPAAKVRVSWSVAGRPVLGSSRFKVEEQGDVSILHISRVEDADAGVVTCIASSESGEAISCSSELLVQANDDDARHPRAMSLSPECDIMSVSDADEATAAEGDGTPAMLLRGPADTTALRGDRVMLKATFVGCPSPNVRWLRAGRELEPNERISITTEDGVSCLALENITADDSGKYVVSVENIFGADCHFASVAVEGPPDPPAGRPTVSLCEGGAIVAWSSAPYDGGCIVTGYCVEKRQSGSSDWQPVAHVSHSLSHVIRDLTSGESYVFRVRAENIHGESKPSMESPSFSFQLDAEDELFTPAFEPRLVSVEPGEEFKAKYDVLEELGKGRYGVVHKVVEHATSQKFAAKFIRCIKAKDREKVQEEIDIMNCLRHPKLLQLAAAFESPREMVMVMEYISGGELFERVVADDFTLTERDCILFMRQICEGVDYMHQSLVVHLDLKPENIMCHTRTSHQIKLIDFGLARKLQIDTPVRVLFGTPEFIPPEIINYEPIGVESDMWSVGVICYVLLSGLSPFMGDNDAETFANITRADYDFEDEAFDAISQDAKDFISSLLLKRKEKRLTAKECLQHMWLAQHDDSMSCVKLSTDKLKKFIIRRKWQKTGNAIRALGRMATLSAASRRNSNASSTSGSPRPSLSGGGVSRMSSLNEEDQDEKHSNHVNGFHRETADVLTKPTRMRLCSERSDSGISDCSSITTPTPQVHQPFCQCPFKPLLGKKFSITEEAEYTNENVNQKFISDFNLKTDLDEPALSAVNKESELNSIKGECVTKVPVSSEKSRVSIPLPLSGKPNLTSSSSPAKCVKKTTCLKQQESVDSGVNVDVGRSVMSKVSSYMKNCQQQNAQRIETPKRIAKEGTGKVSIASSVQVSPKSKASHTNPALSTSNEHSTNYQKAMAFWKR